MEYKNESGFLKMQKNLLEFNIKYMGFLGLSAIFIACSSEKRESNPDTKIRYEHIVTPKSSSYHGSNKLKIWLGNYKYKYTNDTSSFLNLSIEILNKDYIAKLRNSSSADFIQGVLILDSTNYDKSDSVYTFSVGKMSMDLLKRELTIKIRR